MIQRFLKRCITWIFILGTAGAIGYFLILPKLLPLHCKNYVEKYATQYHVEPSLVYAVIFCESGFDPNAVSSANARGLMQVTEDTAIWAAKQIDGIDVDTLQITDPETNIQIGCWYLGWLLEKFDGNTQTSLAGYNAGHNKVAEWLADEEKSKDGLTLDEIPYSETNYYVKKVALVQKAYQWLYRI